MQQFNTQNGQSWIDVCLNTYGTLDYLGKLLNDNNLDIDSFPSSGQSIVWNNELVKDSSIKSLIDANKYVFASSITPFYISSYSAGVSQIDFTNNGGDDWDIDFFANPITQYVVGGTLVDYNIQASFWVSGISISIDNQDNITVDHNSPVSDYGAGVYYLIAHYNYTNGLFFEIQKLVKVDASGNVLASLSTGGIVVNFVNGLDIDLTADVTQVGVDYPIEWFSIDQYSNRTLIGTGVNLITSMPTNAIGVIFSLPLDSVFTNDYISSFDISATISIT